MSRYRRLRPPTTTREVHPEMSADVMSRDVTRDGAVPVSAFDVYTWVVTGVVPEPSSGRAVPNVSRSWLLGMCVRTIGDWDRACETLHISPTTNRALTYPELRELDGGSCECWRQQACCGCYTDPSREKAERAAVVVVLAVVCSWLLVVQFLVELVTIAARVLSVDALRVRQTVVPPTNVFRS